VEKREEKEIAEKKDRIKKAQEARAKAAEEASEMGGMPGGMPGGMGGMGGLFSDPELLESLSDPEVAAAFEDITSNPANIMKYQGNPKVMKLLTHFFASIDDINHVRCQNKGCSIPLEIAKHLSVSEEFSKVNVKQMSTLFHHNVVIMPITDA